MKILLAGIIAFAADEKLPADVPGLIAYMARNDFAGKAANDC